MTDPSRRELSAQPPPTDEQARVFGAPAVGAMVSGEGQDVVSPEQLAAAAAADMDSEGGHDPIARQFE